MRLLCVLAAVLAAVSSSTAQSAAIEDPTLLVRETVYNELHDHQAHGYFRYWIQRRSSQGTRVEEQVETEDGPVTRLLLANGHPLDARGLELERERLRDLLASPSRQANLRDSYRQDERRVGRILALLPDAFVFEDKGIGNGCRHLRFSPNPNYTARTIEARFFHQLNGDLWIDARMKRLRRLEGHMDGNLDIGLGLLGRVNKGSWFRMVRTQVSPTDWKTEQLEIHMTGRLLLFKTLARETSETRGGFEAVAPRMNLEQGLRTLDESVAAREASNGGVWPAALLRETGNKN